MAPRARPSRTMANCSHQQAAAQAEAEDYGDEPDPYDDPEGDYDPYGEDEDSEVSDLARELYYSSLLLQELVEWYQSRRQEQESYEEEYEQYHGFDMTMM